MRDQTAILTTFANNVGPDGVLDELRMAAREVALCALRLERNIHSDVEKTDNKSEQWHDLASELGRLECMIAAIKLATTMGKDIAIGVEMTIDKIEDENLALETESA